MWPVGAGLLALMVITTERSRCVIMGAVPSLTQQRLVSFVTFSTIFDEQSSCSNRTFVPVGSIPSNQTHSFSSLTKIRTDNWIRRKRKSAVPPGIERGSSDCRSDALTTELRSHGVVRASDRQSEDLGSIQRGCAAFCSSDPFSVLIFVEEA